jgi:hypothetical protein
MVRPHPGEKIDPYRYLEELENIQVTGTEDFISDLTRCDAVLTYTSTTVFESIAADKPVFSLDLGEPPEDFKLAHFSILNWITPSQLRSLVAKMNEGETLPCDNDFLDRMSVQMYSPIGNSLLRNVVALVHLASMNKSYPKSRLKRLSYDEFLAKCYLIVPLLKDCVIRGGYSLEKALGFPNLISKWSKRHWARRINKGDYLSEAGKDRAENILNQILRKEELHALENRDYNVKLTSYGWIVSLPKDVDHVKNLWFGKGISKFNPVRS